MPKEKTKLQKAQDKVEQAVRAVNKKIDQLGVCAGDLYDALNGIQTLFDCISNVPQEDKFTYEKLKKIRVQWREQADKIEADYKKTKVRAVGAGAAGVGAGVAVAALGPTAAMGIATTFGVASTGTAISSLSGAAAVNAALAWLGGGALAAGGGGMAAGSALVSLAGPLGWAVAGASALISCLLFIKTKKDKERLEDIFTLITERDAKSFYLAVAEMHERIDRIKNETAILKEAISRIQTFGLDYRKMTEAQQYELGSYVNLMESTTMLLINPISGLTPKFTEEDFKKVCSRCKDDINLIFFEEYKTMIIILCNLFYKIALDDKDKKLICKALRNNKEFLESIDRTKKDFDPWDISLAQEALKIRYKFRP